MLYTSEIHDVYVNYRSLKLEGNEFLNFTIALCISLFLMDLN